MTAFVHADEAVLSETNITPFTDVLLVLLIIFMILAALVVPPGFEKRLDKCNCTAPRIVRHVEPLVVTVRKDGAIFVGSRQTDERGVYPMLARAIAPNVLRPIRLAEDTTSPYRLAIRVLDAAKAAGASNVTLASQ